MSLNENRLDYTLLVAQDAQYPVGKLDRNPGDREYCLQQKRKAVIPNMATHSSGYRTVRFEPVMLLRNQLVRTTA